MGLFFEEDIRGGFYYISKKSSKANNKYFKFYYKTKSQNTLDT